MKTKGEEGGLIKGEVELKDYFCKHWVGGLILCPAPAHFCQCYGLQVIGPAFTRLPIQRFYEHLNLGHTL